MTIQEDILALEQKQKDYFDVKGKYLQCLQTPEAIPLKNTSTDFTKLRKPEDTTDEIVFTPKEKDYAFRVDVWGRKEGLVETSGFIITAMRDLGDSIIETVTRVKLYNGK